MLRFPCALRHRTARSPAYLHAEWLVAEHPLRVLPLHDGFITFRRGLSRPGPSLPVEGEGPHAILRRLHHRDLEGRPIERSDVVSEPDDFLTCHVAVVVERLDEQLDANRGGTVPIGHRACEHGRALSLARLPVDREVLIAAWGEGVQRVARRHDVRGRTAGEGHDETRRDERTDHLHAVSPRDELTSRRAGRYPALCSCPGADSPGSGAGWRRRCGRDDRVARRAGGTGPWRENTA